MTEIPLTLKAMSAADGARISPWLGLRVIIAAVLLELVLLLGVSLGVSGAARAEPVRAEPVKADINVDLSNGFARIVFRFSEEIDADVRMANGILVVNFKSPVTVSVDRLYSNAAGYVSAARRDPDGMAVRMALSQKVRVNSMMAGERLFVDLLPQSWTGMPPGLPQEVVEELAKRARDAERKERQQRLLAKQRQTPLVRVRVSHQPTFSRYVFELAELVPIATERAKDRLKVIFEESLRFDLADAKALLPPTLEVITSEIGEEQTTVSFGFIGKVDVRTFREDNSYVVDISPASGRQERPGGGPLSGAEPKEPPKDKLAAGTEIDVPQTKPAAPEMKPAVKPADPPREPSPVRAAPPIAPPSVEVAAVKSAEQNVPPPLEKATESKPVVPEAAVEAPQERPKVTADPGAPLKVEMRRQGDSLRLVFPFAAPTAAAVFRRADTLWLVFDSSTKIDLGVLAADTSRTIRNAVITGSAGGQVVRIKLERPRLTSMSTEGLAWAVTIGDVVLTPTKPLTLTRDVVGATRPTVSVLFDEPQTIHRLSDPDVGDTLVAVTGFGPARGLLKSQDFVEFRALASTHGVAIQPLADDVQVEIALDKVVVGRPAGLALSAGNQLTKRSGSYRPQMFDAQLWGFDRQTLFNDRQDKLINAAAAAPETKRTGPRYELARFYLARDMYPEAKAVLDLALNDERPTSDDSTGLVMRAVANIMLGRSDDAFKDLANPLVGTQHNSPLWRSFALARQGKWREAREGFRTSGALIGSLPVELQRTVLKESVRSAIEVRDFAGAASLLNEFETLGIPPDVEPSLAVLNGRVAEGLGRNEDALAAYRSAADADDRPSAAQGQLREIVLRYQLGDMPRADVISELEALTTVWRGDETEVEALQLLARLYTEETRYRDAFYVMRTALKAHPNSEMTRRIHDEAAATFDALFLAGKGDALPAIDALGLFYDFRELTPIGRRGDEMIRRLTDRLVAVDLLDQAAELLQHQVDHRLQGAARAQVANRLAVIYLMNHKPERALQTIRATRTADLSNELRNQRLLLEARALSDIGRHDVAMEVIANIEGKEAIRLRSDILWAAKRWRESAEQIEVLYGDRWRDWQPLSDSERADLLRAGLGYALGEDALGLDRFRGKYAAKMADAAERRAFDIVTEPASANNAEFRDVARTIAAVDTLEGFLRDMRARYPETGAFGQVPSVVPSVPDAASEPRAALPDPTPTGSVKRPKAKKRVKSAAR